MAVADISVLRVVGRFQSQNIVNTLHYYHSAQTSTELAVLLNLCTIFEANVGAAWRGRHSNNYDMIGLKAFRHTGTAKIPGFLSIGVSGSVVADDVPSYVCRTITLYTASANHRRRGRIMLSGSVDSMFDSSDGSVTTAEITSLDALGTSILATLSGGGDSFDLCIPPSGALPYEDIIDSRARETPASVTTRRVRQFFVG